MFIFLASSASDLGGVLVRVAASPLGWRFGLPAPPLLFLFWGLPFFAAAGLAGFLAGLHAYPSAPTMRETGPLARDLQLCGWK